MSLYPKVILIGDATTQKSFGQHNNINSWGAALSHRLTRKCDVYNRGFSGYNTHMTKQILPELITKGISLEVAVVVIFLGSNDAILEECSPKQHVPVLEYKANLKEMAQYLLTVSILREKIILITPPPLDEEKWEKECTAKAIISILRAVPKYLLEVTPSIDEARIPSLPSILTVCSGHKQHQAFR
ncbi:isoamyl acetate-hydrolyzing esterase 1 homolog [Saccoglossus kowalevskii]|uniref:Isoamyl acetate-hydrolyzing esterase 1 homolog n=1 Tax=Saccoglossus kowalevskii TaxID=10224 RepID=A0ABM0MLE8_SACKO|nr:PREDICTED: isoamyl acetate-hydrolyzing esterase 1 homolog [Saccoglossus kowalevskii]